MAENKKLDNATFEGEGLAEDFDKFEAFFIENGKIILAGCVAVILIVAAVMIVLQVNKTNKAELLKEFGAAKTTESIRKVLEKSPSGAAAAEARIRLAKLLTEAKDHKGAVEQYDLAAKDKNASDFARGRAMLDAAYLVELDGKNADAVARFKKAAADLKLPEDMKMEAFYGTGRLCVASGNIAEARQAFSRAYVKRPMSGAAAFWSMQAKSALDRLPSKDQPAKK